MHAHAGKNVVLRYNADINLHISWDIPENGWMEIGTPNQNQHESKNKPLNV